MKKSQVESWKVERLGDIGKVSMCKRIFKDQTTLTGDIPFYKIGTFGKEPDAYISKEIYDEFRNKFSFPKKGDILISASGTIGRRVKYDGEPAYFQDSNIVWIDNDEKQVLNDYLYHFYGACNWNSTKGATISRLYTTNLQQIEIAFPKSLPEQQRIVSVLDEAFESIAQAKSNAERNLVNARELFGSYLGSLFADSRAGWEEKKLGEVCERITDGTHVTPTYVPKGVPFLSVKNLTKGFIDFSDTRFISLEEHKLLTKRVRPERDDLLYTKVGTTGVAQVVDVDVEFSIFVSIALLKLKHDMIFNKYLEFFLNSPFARRQAQNRTRGMANKNLVITDIKEIEIHFPKSLAEQRAIVGRLEALAAETRSLEGIYQQKVESLEELKRSVLAKAFEGEL